MNRNDIFKYKFCLGGAFYSSLIKVKPDSILKEKLVKKLYSHHEL